MDNTLFFYGNENLSKSRLFSVSMDGTRNATPVELQSIPLARSNGSTLVNERLTQKIIQLRGTLEVGQDFEDLQEVIKRYDSIFTNEGGLDNTYLRVVNKWQEIIPLPTSGTSNWSVDNDGDNLSNTTDDVQLNNGLKFDIDVSKSTNDRATLLYSAPAGTSYDYSDIAETGNIEFWVYIPDSQYITSIYFEIDNGAGDGWTGEFGFDYQGNRIHNGWNFFSVAWEDMEVSGTPDGSDIGELDLRIEYQADCEDMTGVVFGGCIWTDEDRLRNFPAKLTGDLTRTGEAHQIAYTKWQGSFLNYTGYAISTHSKELFDTNITGLTDTETFEIDGSLKPLVLHTFTINDKTNLYNFKLQRVDSDKYLTLSPDSIEDDDILYFGGIDKLYKKGEEPVDFEGLIPETDLGFNRLRLTLGSGTTATVGNSAVGSDYKWVNSSHRYSQKFASVKTGKITDVTATIVRCAFDSTQNLIWTFAIYSDNSGNPGAEIDSVTVDFGRGTPGIGGAVVGGPYTVTFSNCPVVSGTSYHLVIYTNYSSLSGSNTWRQASASGSNSRESTDSGSSWSTISSWAFNHSIKIEDNPSWDIDWKATYRKLYRA